MEILFTWIGTADYDASQVDSLDRPGPVMQALKTETFDKVILIQSVMPKNEKSLDKKRNEFLDWLKSKSSCDNELMKIQISFQKKPKKLSANRASSNIKLWNFGGIPYLTFILVSNFLKKVIK